ncbi:MAG: dihydroneopterin aldolase [Anaerolineae bacterium]|nr:dihydroneopterin aldolase [Anaerolineae bacterium]MCB0181716.1 dihydroneopterin aldolase [Anaerolineae bacterium]MCB9108973.1 dihydroneopterin aldolase [Anaerolineales bacterium]
MNDSLDKIFVRDLLIRGILGVNPDERTNRQDILVNFTMWVDTRAAGKSDNIGDSVNYKTITKAIIKHIERSKPYLIERLVADLVQVCFDTNPRVQAVEMSVEKPTALRFARSVGVTIYREREG